MEPGEEETLVAGGEEQAAAGRERCGEADGEPGGELDSEAGGESGSGRGGEAGGGRGGEAGGEADDGTGGESGGVSDSKPGDEPGSEQPAKRHAASLGTPPPDIVDLARLEDRLSFVYFEHCKIHRDDNAITATDSEGTVHVPAAALSVLMLGPGCSVTHGAMKVIGDNGATVLWVGERGVRMYACGKSLTHSSALLQRQAALVSNNRDRLAVARKMYGMRFAGEDVERLTMQQLRGREGARVRRVYNELSQSTGVAWDKRTYDPDDYEEGSEINKALSAAHTCLYGLAHAAIVALGCSPGLGFVHTGHERSFVYDVADLYKAETSIPVAFEVAAKEPDDIGSSVRRAMRDAVYDLSLLKRMARDIRWLLSAEDEGGSGGLAGQDDGGEADHVGLWDERVGEVAAGVSYGEDDDGEEGSGEGVLA